MLHGSRGIDASGPDYDLPCFYPVPLTYVFSTLLLPFSSFDLLPLSMTLALPLVNRGPEMHVTLQIFSESQTYRIRLHMVS